MPKIGPLKALDFNIPTAKTENMYFASINLTVENYGSLLDEVRARREKLPDDDLDSGKPTAAGEYTLADDTYAKLLSQLAEKKFDATTPALQKNILGFYANASAPNDTKKDPGKWEKVQANLDALKAFVPSPAPPAASAAPAPAGNLQ